MVEDALVLEESQVPNAKEFSLARFTLWDIQVLARPHGIEEGSHD